LLKISQVNSTFISASYNAVPHFYFRYKKEWSVDTMAKKVTITQKYQVWIEARRRYHLSDVQVQMARELGLNPNKFGKLANEKQEPWKKPLPEFIEEIYYKRFGRRQPEIVRSIEQLVQDQREKKADRKERREKPSEQ